MSDLKILVCGDVEGKFKYLFSRISSVHLKKGPFESLLCVGNFFGNDLQEWEDVKAGRIKAPITTYVLGPCKPEHSKFFPDESGELASNIIFLGKKGLLSGSSGLKIAYLSGLEGKSSGNHIFDANDVSHLITNFSNGSHNAVDILLTSQWPQGVTRYAVTPEDLDTSRTDSEIISQLAKVLKPRYHFSGLQGLYYERLPYRNHQVLQEMPVHASRFIGLAPVDNSKKLKWMYAFSIIPLCSMTAKDLTKVTGPVTECPYTFTPSHKGVLQKEESSQFFYDMNSSNSGKKRQQNNGGAGSNKKREFQGPCWFCLTNPEVQKQLFISIGEDCYVTLAKGGLVPDHLLIVPINHYQASVNLPEAALTEINKYKSALIKYFDSKGKDVIFFERNYASPHLQIQVVPIPKNLKASIKEVLLDFSDSYNIQFDELAHFSLLMQVVPPKKPYFFIEVIVNGKEEAKFLHVINQKFPLQFGRMLLASKHILNVPERMDWKACNETKDEETELREKFRRDFKPFDFSES